MLTWAQKRKINKLGYFDFPLKRGAIHAQPAIKPLDDIHILPYPNRKLPPPKFGLPVKRMPWETPGRGREFVPPAKEVSVMLIDTGAKLKSMKPSIFARQKYGGWKRKSSGGFYGLGNVIPGMAKSHPGMLPTEIKTKQEAFVKAQQLEIEKQEESELLKREAELAKKQAQIWEAEEKAAMEKILAAEPKYEYLTLDKSHQMDVVRDRLSKGWAINTQDEGWIVLQKRLNGLNGLGWSFKKAVKQLTSAGRKTFSPPKKIKKELGAVTKKGLKLMKIALKPSGAKLLAKKGGMKAAISNPDKFIGMYNQKLHERNEKGKESEREQEQAGVQPAEQFEVDGKMYTREEFIATFGVTPEQYEAGYEPPASPVEEQPQPIYLDDPKMPELPSEPVPTPTEPAPSYDYPAEEYYPEETELIDYAMNPDEWIYEEKPYYEGQDISYPEEEVIKGTEWYYEKPFDARRIEDIPLGTEYEETYWRSEAINPTADWYRGTEPYPHSEKETDYIIPVNFKQKVSPEYSRGFVKPLSGLGLLFKQRGSRQRYFPEGYRPTRPRPVSPAFTRLTKTNKYEPDEITNIPVPVSRNIRLTYNRDKRNF